MINHMKSTDTISDCIVCGSKEFQYNDVLWSELISSWQLSTIEINYINRQQGLYCQHCENNLRSISLAQAILKCIPYNGTLHDFCNSNSKIKLLEINTAGNLTPFLDKLSGHQLIEYPMFDMQNLAIDSDVFDFVIHSDTLEHVPNPIKALEECRRVLHINGRCIFTIPIIVDRLTRNRTGLTPSYHGRSGVPDHDQLVHSEFGVDVWKMVLQAGFSSCEIYSFEYPSALVFIATK
jgi:SAM-dependent methyltransferase